MLALLVVFGCLCGVFSCPSEHLPWCFSLSNGNVSSITRPSRGKKQFVQVIGTSIIEDETCLLAVCFVDVLVISWSRLVLRVFIVGYIMSHRTHTEVVVLQVQSRINFALSVLGSGRLGAQLVRTYSIHMVHIMRTWISQ